MGGGGDGEDSTYGESDRVLAPTLVQLPSGAGAVVRASAGYTHTVLECECVDPERGGGSGRRSVYTFGQNESGQLATVTAAAVAAAKGAAVGDVDGDAAVVEAASVAVPTPALIAPLPFEQD